MTMQCPSCQKEIPEDSTFCLSCGRPIKEAGADIIVPPSGSNTEERAMIYLLLSIMFLFFGGFLLIPGIFVGWGMIIPALCVVVVGLILMSARFAVLRRYTKNVLEIRKEASVKVKCQYCGTLNPERVKKCESCGATL